MYRARNLSNIKLIKGKPLCGKTRNSWSKNSKYQSCSVRYASSGSNSSSAGSFYAGSLAVVVGLAGGGAITYAKYDSTFRQSMEETLPFMKPLLESLHGSSNSDKNLLPPPPVEKDLSIAFEVNKPDKELIQDEIQAPLYSDHITTKNDDVVVINALDSAAVSQIDLDISNLRSKKKTAKEDEAPAPFYSDHITTKTDDVVVINALDSPGVSQIDLDISNLRSKKKAAKEESTAKKGNLPAAEDIIVTEDVSTAKDAPKAEVKEVVEDTKQNDMGDFVVIEPPKVENSAESQNESNIQTKEEPIAYSTIPENMSSLEGNESLQVSKDEVKDSPLDIEEIKSLQDVVDETFLESLLEATNEYIKAQSDDLTVARNNASESVQIYTINLSHKMCLPKGHVDIDYIQNKLNDIESTSQTAIDDAAVKEAQLQQDLQNFKDLIDTVKKTNVSELTESSEALLNECSQKIKDSNLKLENANKELSFMNKIEQLISDLPENLQSPVASFAPELTEFLQKYRNEIDFESLKPEQALISYIFKKNESLESTLNDKSLIELEKMRAIINEEKEKIMKESEEKFNEEVKRVEKEQTEEQEKRMKKIEEEYEKEMLAQLKRQASAHNEHLTDQLTSQANTLNSKHQQETDTKITELREKQQLQLEKNLGQISGIENKLSDIVDADRKQQRAQQLWIAAQSLSSGLKEPLSHGRTRTLTPDLLSLLHLSGENKVIEEIIASFPQDSASIGVVPEKELFARFKSVKNACTKVAMIKEEGGAIPTYILSYLKSVFMFTSWFNFNPNDDIDLNKLDSYEILEKADYFIKEGDLEQATKFLSQLKGVPRKFCSDWLREAILYLETKQTATLLMAYAASLSVGFE